MYYTRFAFHWLMVSLCILSFTVQADDTNTLENPATSAYKEGMTQSLTGIEVMDETTPEDMEDDAPASLSIQAVKPMKLMDEKGEALTKDLKNEVSEALEALEDPKPVKLSGSKLTKLLKSGGYVIFMRHSISEEQGEEQALNLEKCETQRNLSEKGKKQATMIGKVVKKLDIPIGDVHSSPYCRCIDTARLVFDKEIEVHEELMFAASLENDEERAEYSETLHKMLSIEPEEGTNTVIISHSVNLQEAAGIVAKPEGVIHVFKPKTEGFEHLGSIKPDFWDIFMMTTH